MLSHCYLLNYWTNSQKYLCVELFWKLILEFSTRFIIVFFAFDLLSPKCLMSQHLWTTSILIRRIINYLHYHFDYQKFWAHFIHGLMFPQFLCNNKPAGIKLMNSSLYTPNLVALHQLVSSWHVLCTCLRQLLKQVSPIYACACIICGIRFHWASISFISYFSKTQSGISALLINWYLD